MLCLTPCFLDLNKTTTCLRGTSVTYFKRTCLFGGRDVRFVSRACKLGTRQRPHKTQSRGRGTAPGVAGTHLPHSAPHGADAGPSALPAPPAPRIRKPRAEDVPLREATWPQRRLHFAHTRQSRMKPNKRLNGNHTRHTHTLSLKLQFYSNQILGAL